MVDYPAQWARPIFEDPPAYVPEDIPIVGSAGITITGTATPTIKRYKRISGTASLTILPTNPGGSKRVVKISGSASLGLIPVLGPRTNIPVIGDTGVTITGSATPRVRHYVRITGSASLGLVPTGDMSTTLKIQANPYTETPTVSIGGEGTVTVITPLAEPPGGLWDPLEEDWIFEPDDSWSADD